MNQKNNDSKICQICGRSTYKESKYCIFHASAEEKTETDFIRELKKHIKEIKEKNEDYNFEKFIFIGDIDFKKDLDITVFKKAKFNETTFEGTSDFGDATFKGTAYLRGATFKGDAIFSAATFEGKADFTNVTFKGDASFFYKITFEENKYFCYRATFKGKAEFSMAIFEENACFCRAIFMLGADFYDATFKGCADFKRATFKGKAEFREATFEEIVCFEESTFKGEVWFEYARIMKDANFIAAIFFESAHFTAANFKGIAYFYKTNFKQIADFKKATFMGMADFSSAIFKEDANFSSLKFLSSITLRDALFEGDIFFKNTNFSPKNNLNLKVIGDGFVSFEHTWLENISLELVLGRQVQVDFINSMLRNSKIRKEQIENHIYQEIFKDFSHAKEVYLLLKNNFNSIGRYDDESWAFKKEKDMERKSYYFNAFTKNIESKEEKKEEKDQRVKKSKVILYSNWIKAKEFIKWLWSCFCNAIYGYGEKPQNVVISALIIILLFSVFFSILGINSPEIIEMKSPTVQEIFNGDSEIISKGVLISKTTNNSIDCIYFSAITFTTLGYGDFRPLEGWGRILAGSEAFIGAFMMALFVYTFARRTGGR